MNAAIKKEGAICALGAMSGTSLDGVDVAMLETDGHDIVSFGASHYRPYTTEERAVIAKALGKWFGDEVDAAAQVVDHVHQEAMDGFYGVEMAGFHGQTLAHDPAGRRTLQVGDGAALAKALDVPVVWDFRSADIQFGGEGAPLASFFHHACARYIGETAPVAFLNLGGVGNLTWVDPSNPDPAAPDVLMAFDTGPANAPLNDLMQSRFNQPYDKGGALAAQGKVHQDVVEAFLDDPYFARVPPKSLDRDDFAQIPDLVSGLADQDAAATLLGLCAASVAEGVAHCPVPPSRVVITGGGRNNPVLMQMLSNALPCPIVAAESVRLDGDMLEAQAFAYLAVRVARRLPTTCPGTTGVAAPVGGGTISGP